jgi:hypothetical protein
MRFLGSGEDFERVTVAGLLPELRGGETAEGGDGFLFSVHRAGFPFLM